MSAIIFKTQNAVFMFDQANVKERLICKKAEYAPDEVSHSLELISTDSDEIILSLRDH